MDRRHFLQAMAITSGSLMSIGPDAWAMAPDIASAHPRKLIVIMLRGAVDGLNVVVPYGDANYYRLRPTIAVARPGQENGALDLDGYFGLHPALGSLQELWRERKLAFVHAAGSPDPTRSHFDAQDYVESGTPSRKGTQDGWMNRLLTVSGGASVPTRAISIGPVMPRILSGRAVATNIASGPAGTRATLLDRPHIANAFDQLYQTNDRFAQIYQQAQVAHKEVMASMESESQLADGGAPLPNGFPDDAARLATLMRKDPKVQFAFMALGGWDTHANQGAGTGQLANRLAPLGQGLAILAKRLGPLFDSTTIVVVSEFGRTVRQNGNNGTDHGHGNVMWILGGAVTGGKVYGDWQGLDEAHLYEGRDVPVTTDFRHVLAHIAERHLRLSDKQLMELFPAMPARGSAPDFIRA
ncbi:MAG: DUF1501 domain-containing protein [Herminiimonas sp.]|nr:DUF1501 domain-containing protein [Herminiimonas sp.]